MHTAIRSICANNGSDDARRDAERVGHESSVGELGDAMVEEERVCWLGWSKRLATRSGRRVFALCEVDEEATPTAVDCVCTFVFKIRFGSL